MFINEPVISDRSQATLFGYLHLSRGGMVLRSTMWSQKSRLLYLDEMRLD